MYQQKDWHEETFPQGQKAEAARNPTSQKCLTAVKRLRQLPRSLHDISESPSETARLIPVFEGVNKHNGM